MENNLAITDRRTNTVYDVPIQDGAIRAIDLRQIRSDPELEPEITTLPS